MPVITLGWRRLYDALGFSIAESGPIIAAATLQNGRQLNFYLGLEPPMGVVSINEGGYLVPGHSVEILRTDTEYKADCFCEISITWEKEISTQQESQLTEANNELQQTILEEAENSLCDAENMLDRIAATFGLTIHRQLVLKPLIEHPFFTNGTTPVSSFIGPIWEQLAHLEANCDTQIAVLNLLKIFELPTEKAIIKEGATLHWLLKAWREQDPITKFMYLFIPLEAAVQATSEIGKNSIAELNAIREIVEASDAEERQELMNFIDRAKTKFNPTLNARFEELAKKHSLPGWELDVEAFKKFNRMRNLLLHTGNKRLNTHISFEQNTRTLEDLVERYVALEIVGHPSVYKSWYRPNR